MILNYTDGVNYTNADMQYTKFIENTIRPRERKVEQLVNILLDHYENDISTRTTQEVTIKIRDEHISDINERIDTAVKQIASGVLTINEARKELGYELYE